jgi:hypothetical protein
MTLCPEPWTWATDQHLPVDRVVTEVGPALSGQRRKLLSLLADESVAIIVVEHRDRFARFGAPYVQAALSASGTSSSLLSPADLRPAARTAAARTRLAGNAARSGVSSAGSTSA